METTWHDLDVIWREALLWVGRSLALTQPAIPGMRNYYVLSLAHSPASSDGGEAFFLVAHRIARALATRHHGNPECYTVIFNGAHTRRSPWPHVHILVAESVRSRRRGLVLLQLKLLLRWRRWPVVRWGAGPARDVRGPPVDVPVAPVPRLLPRREVGPRVTPGACTRAGHGSCPLARLARP